VTGLDHQELAAVRDALRTAHGRQSLYGTIARDSAEARAGWLDGRRIGGIALATWTEPPARVVPILLIHVTYYWARKGRGDRGATYVHEHRKPFPLLARAARKNEHATRNARDVGRPTGPDVFALGELVGFEGSPPRWLEERTEIGFPRRARVTLAADPRTRRMLVLGAPLYVLSNGSRYSVEDRGIVG